MKRAAILSYSLTLSLFLPLGVVAQGSGSKPAFRLINFDEVRQVCLGAEVELFEDHKGDAVGLLEEGGTQDATAMSLDQDWFQVQIGDEAFLVRSEDLTFGAC